MDKQNPETHNESESLELREFDQVESDVLVDDYKDMQIDMVESSRGKRLGWNKYTVDKVTGFNENDR
jgi:hypothetical protein